MPHIVIKMFPGRSEEQKQSFSDEIVKKAVEILGCRERSLSVAFEEIPEGEWNERVYRPEIEGKKETLAKRPGYGSLAE